MGGISDDMMMEIFLSANIDILETMKKDRSMLDELQRITNNEKATKKRQSYPYKMFIIANNRIDGATNVNIIIEIRTKKITVPFAIIQIIFRSKETITNKFFHRNIQSVDNNVESARASKD